MPRVDETGVKPYNRFTRSRGSRWLIKRLLPESLTESQSHFVTCCPGKQGVVEWVVVKDGKKSSVGVTVVKKRLI